MTTRWFYSHDGRTHGPLSREQIKHLAGLGLLDPGDLLWTEGASESEAIMAQAALDFTEAAEAPAPLPDWLEDARHAEAVPPPDPGFAPAAIPDWLADIAAAETPPPAATQDVAEIVPTEPQPEPIETGRRETEVRPAEPTGFDPETGRVEDSARFQAWQQEQRPSQPDADSPPVSPYETFRRARKEIEDWVDLEQNRERVRTGDVQALGEDPELQQLIRSYEGHGAEMVRKLWHHLVFIVENRRKYYSACTPRRSD